MEEKIIQILKDFKKDLDEIKSDIKNSNYGRYNYKKRSSLMRKASIRMNEK